MACKCYNYKEIDLLMTSFLTISIMEASLVILLQIFSILSNFTFILDCIDQDEETLPNFYLSLFSNHCQTLIEIVKRQTNYISFKSKMFISISGFRLLLQKTKTFQMIWLELYYMENWSTMKRNALIRSLTAVQFCNTDCWMDHWRTSFC